MDPSFVAAIVAAAGMSQTSGMSVDDADDAEPAIFLPQDAASERLGCAIEAHMRDPRFPFRASRQGGQCDRLVFEPQAHENPAGLLFAAHIFAVLGIFFEQCPADA